MRISKEVIFDELKRWYGDANHGIGANVKESAFAKNARLQSQVLSGPQGSPSISSIENLWSGKLCEKKSPRGSSNVSWKGKEKVDDASRMPSLSVGPDDVDSSKSEQSLDDEFSIL